MTSLACCSGFLDSGIPQGKEEIIDQIKCYVAEPAIPSEHCIVIGTDIFGYTLPNVRLIADQYAKQGYKCIIPDCFNGTEIPADKLTDFKLATTGSIMQRISAGTKILYHMPLFLLRNPVSQSLDRVEKVVTELRKTYKKVGFQGYCWGGKVGILLGQKSIFDAMCIAHPGGSINIPEDIELMKTPVYFVLAELENWFSIDKAQLILEIIKKRGDGSDGLIYPAVEHGFAVRGDENNPNVLKQRELALEHAFAFFKARFP